MNVKNQIRLERFRITTYWLALAVCVWYIAIMLLVDLVRARNIINITNVYVENVQNVQSKGELTIEEKIRQAFPDNADTMLAIAKAESRLNPKAVNVNRNGSKDCGIFQINSIHGYDCEWLKDVDNNIRVAREVLEKQGLTAWVTYNWAIANNKPI